MSDERRRVQALGFKLALSLLLFGLAVIAAMLIAAARFGRAPGGAPVAIGVLVAIAFVGVSAATAIRFLRRDPATDASPAEGGSARRSPIMSRQRRAKLILAAGLVLLALAFASRSWRASTPQTPAATSRP